MVDKTKKQQVVDGPAKKKPATKKPATKKPAAKKPAAKKPAAKKPAAKKPAAKKPAAKKPATIVTQLQANVLSDSIVNEILSDLKEAAGITVTSPEDKIINQHYPDCSESDRTALQPILANYLKYAATSNAVGGQYSFDLTKLAPVICYVYRRLIIREYVGVQPMKGPVGLIYTLQLKSHLENKMSIQVLSSIIEAKSRMLSARWSIEAAQDLNEFHDRHGIDMEMEIFKALGAEIAEDIICELNNDIITLAGKHKTKVKLRKWMDVDHIALAISKAANQVGRTCRRGTGNFAVVPLDIAHAICFSGNNSFKPANPEPHSVQPYSYIGEYSNGIKVFAGSPWQEDIVVGYKGKNGETDTGLIWAPYILLMSTSLVVDPLTYQPILTFMTRYGKSSVASSTTTMKDEETMRLASYYALVKHDYPIHERIAMAYNKKVAQWKQTDITAKNLIAVIKQKYNKLKTMRITK